MSCRELGFWGLSIGMGTVMSGMVHVVFNIDPLIIPTATGISLAIFGGCGWAAKRFDSENIMKWKAPLFMGLGNNQTVVLF